MCDRFPRKFDVQTSYKPSNVNIKFPRATYHTIVPSTEELCCLNRESLGMGTNRLLPVIIQQICPYAHIWSGSPHYLSSAHDRYPAIYVTDHIWKCTADLSRLAQVAILKVRGSFHSVFQKFKNTLNEIFQDLQSTRFTHERSFNEDCILHVRIPFFNWINVFL